MCTVTFLPTSNGCIISSNRDEIISRAPAEPPMVREIAGKPLLFPRDPVGKGTWIASSAEASVCLFNGAFEPHQHRPPYRLSRGVVPLEYFQFLDVQKFTSTFNFSGIEPFSMIIYRKDELHEIKWDEERIHIIEHDANQPHIWASVTLYDKTVREQRSQWFKEWLQSEPEHTQENALAFHTSERGDHINGLFINRPNGLRTVSVTSIAHARGQGSRMVYRDLVKEQSYEQHLKARA